MNFSEAMFFENYLTSDSHTNTVISDVFAYSSGVKNRDKAYFQHGGNIIFNYREINSFKLRDLKKYKLKLGQGIK